MKKFALEGDDLWEHFSLSLKSCRLSSILMNYKQFNMSLSLLDNAFELLLHLLSQWACHVTPLLHFKWLKSIPLFTICLRSESYQRG